MTMQAETEPRIIPTTGEELMLLRIRAFPKPLPRLQQAPVAKRAGITTQELIIIERGEWADPPAELVERIKRAIREIQAEASAAGAQ
jgi:hypothetical protein